VQIVFQVFGSPDPHPNISDLVHAVDKNPFSISDFTNIKNSTFFAANLTMSREFNVVSTPCAKNLFYDFLIDPGFTHVTDPQQPASANFSDEGDDGILLLAEE
jgi:hypothetical protein